ncbi:MAG: hypothetical protein HFH33_16110 [Eubacterium sp.]|jgi:Predicted nucleotidyltransferase|nr:hypothetical protein [Eubacterium sp.]
MPARCSAWRRTVFDRFPAWQGIACASKYLFVEKGDPLFWRLCAGAPGSIRLYIDKSEHPKLDTEIFVDAQYEHYPLREYVKQCEVMHTVVRDYDKIGKRNHKKDRNHLNKHAMHLVRLLMTAICLLEEGVIRTRQTEGIPLYSDGCKSGFPCLVIENSSQIC